jgi:hypothetical protein
MTHDPPSADEVSIPSSVDEDAPPNTAGDNTDGHSGTDEADSSGGIWTTLEIDKEMMQDVIDEKADELRAEATGYAPGSLHGTDGEFRVGLNPYGEFSRLISGVIENTLPRHVDQFADTDPKHIHLSAVHIQTEKPSYVEFFVDEPAASEDEETGDATADATRRGTDETFTVGADGDE